MWRFLALFLLILLTLFTIELLKPVQEWVVIPWTDLLARISAAPLLLFDPNVQANGIIIQNTKSFVGVSIEPGCNGVEASIVLISAMLAFPAPWKYKLTGIAAGLLAPQGLNVLRIISLFYLVQWNAAAFKFAHLYLWQALIMLDVLIIWLIWIRLVTNKPADSEPPCATA